jgi:hypothetical protein
MPGAAFHSFYWSTPSVVLPDPPLGASASGGYVPWQTSVTRLMGVLSQPCLQLVS